MPETTRSGPTYLGVDVGTGSTKAVVTDETGAVLATAQRSHKMSMPGGGCAEFDAEATWWRELVELTQELMAQTGPDRLAAMCVSGMGPCLVLTDDALRPTRPAILYGIDTRASEQVEALTDELGAGPILEVGDKALSSQAVGPKIRWVREIEPEVFERSTRIFSCHSYLAARLTGEYTLDHHTASQYAPMYDMTRGGWHEEWARRVADPIPLPRLAWADEVIGTVTAQAAAETGLPAGTPVCAGTVDAWAEAFSAGVRDDGDLMIMYGSTMFFVQQTSTYRTDPLLWTTTGVQRDTLTLAAGTSIGGSLTTWLQELVGDVPFAQLLEEMEGCRPVPRVCSCCPTSPVRGRRSSTRTPAARSSA